MTNQRCGNWYFVYTGEESIHVGSSRAVHFFNPGKMDLHSVRLRQRITDFEEIITEIQRVSDNEEEVEEEDEDLDSSSDTFRMSSTGVRISEE